MSIKDLSKQELTGLYKKHGSGSKIGKLYGVRKHIVYYHMDQLGIDRKPNKFHSCDYDFFTRENEKTFYWAGFIAADGCVKRGDTLAISLSTKDLKNLEKFKKDIKATNEIKIRTVKANNPNHNDTESCTISIYSRKIFNDLAKFNVVPAKIKIYKFPEWLIEHPLVHHFMRGYFDGDGSLYTNDFLSVFRNILAKNLNLLDDTGYFRPRSSIYSLSYGGYYLPLEIADFLYKDATIYFERKKRNI